MWKILLQKEVDRKFDLKAKVSAIQSKCLKLKISASAKGNNRAEA